MHPFYIMAKPVCGVCNLACQYCYYLDKPRTLYPGVQRFMMDEPVLDTYVRQYLATQPVQANFGWQGGEPLLAGLEFYRRAVELQKEHGQSGQVVANALQTNGTLLDEAWCDFLAEHKFLVGLSLDGPPEWHDSFRRDRAGEPSFARAWRGLEMLRARGVEFNVLVTLNSRNAPHVGDIYRYFVNRGVRWLQFIPVLEKDEQGRPREFSCTGAQFGRFMLEVFELWRTRHIGAVSERLIDSVLNSIVHGQAAVCCNARRCANAYVLEFNGDLYACDHFVYREWLIGNILQRPLAELVVDPLLEEFAALKEDLPQACRECEFLAWCNGGCPKHHIPDAAGRDPARVNHFCEGYKMFFGHALPELKRIASAVQRGEEPAAIMAAGAITRVAGAAGVAGVSPAQKTPGSPSSPDAGGTPATHRTPRRNELCPCGSGRKFKQCCGRR